jgi:hypothetical protein
MRKSGSGRPAAMVCVMALALGACVGLTRDDYALEDRTGAAPPGYAAGAEPPLRFFVDDPDRIALFEQQVTRGLQVGPDVRFDVLALSGGGANGAFTAGVMNGWTEAGTRPDFEVVTGVSTGALAAPFVFLGPAWDDELAEAYIGGAADGLLRPQGLGVFFGSGVFDDAPLRQLVERYIDEEMLAAIAAEHRKGRALLVATTDLDAQRGVSWDMGVIAARGGPEAVQLFRDVLVASASVPGVFPPVLIESRSGAVVFREMHVDGGVTTPFLALPEDMWSFRDSSGHLQGARLHVIVNGKLAPEFGVTPDTPQSVLGRSVDVLLRGALISALAGNRAFAERNGVQFRYAALPEDLDAPPLSFRTETMRRVYEAGRQGALSGDIWR